MRLFLTSILVLATTGMARAEDLPDNAVVTNRTAEVTIDSLTDARISHDETTVTDIGGQRQIRINAALEFALQVEGNLCGSSPSDVHINLKRRQDAPTLVTLARQYTTDPFSSILQGCLAYSAPRNITAAIRLYEYAQGDVWVKQFEVPIDSYPIPSQVIVEVRYDVASGLTATVIR